MPTNNDPLKAAIIAEVCVDLCNECLPAGRCRLLFHSPEQLDRDLEHGASLPRDYRPDAPYLPNGDE